MEQILFLTLLLTWATLQSQGCHPEKKAEFDNDENTDVDTTPGTATRMKRSFHSEPLLSLEEYFESCMLSFRRFRPIDIQTIVKFTIGETNWYERSDVNFCTSDTVNCWQSILYRYMNRNSELFAPALLCMRKYGDYRGNPSDKLQPLKYYAPLTRFRQRRQASTGLPINPGVAANQLRRAVPGFMGDFASLIQFFQQDAICSPGICDCRGITLQPGEVCGQNWYTKLGASIRISSPFRAPLVYILNVITQVAARQQQSQRIRQRQQRQQQQLLQTIVINSVAQSLESSRESTPAPTTQSSSPRQSTPAPTSLSCPVGHQWTPWFDRDNPGGNGDYEVLEYLWIEYPGSICEEPKSIEARLVSNKAAWHTAGENIEMSLATGFFCVNRDQADNVCEDYEVRFLCCPGE